MLAQRVTAAAIGIPVILALIIIGGWPYAIVAALALAVAAAELEHMHAAWTSPRTIFTATVVGGMAVLAHGLGGTVVALLAVAALFTLIGGLILAGSPRTGDEVLAPQLARDMAVTLLYVGVLGSTIVLLRDIHDGRDWVLLAVLSTFAVHTGAYFTGRTFGRHKMAPAISPNKTWEGFAGGCVAGAVTVVALNFILGCHPGPNTASFASGVGSKSLTVAYGVNRADWSYIPGGSASGTALIRPDFPELKHWPFFWQQTEYVLGRGTTDYLLLVLAADHALNR